MNRSCSASSPHVQSREVSSGKIGLNAPPFMTRPEVANGNGAAGNGAPKPRVRARRGHATDPHSIAERVSEPFFFFPLSETLNFNGSIQKILRFDLSTVLMYLAAPKGEDL